MKALSYLNKSHVVVVSALIFAFGGFYIWMNFIEDSYDTYYLWNSAYFIGTSLSLVILYGLFYFLIRKIIKNKWQVNSWLFYINISLSLFCYLCILFSKILLDEGIQNTITFDITMVLMIDPDLYTVLNACFIGLLALQLPIFVNLTNSLIKRKELWTRWKLKVWTRKHLWNSRLVVRYFLAEKSSLLWWFE